MICDVCGHEVDNVIVRVDPMDVPAIPEPHKILLHHKGEYWGCGMDACSSTEDKYQAGWTCQDKNRILEHDENDPPKYWCRKVQN